MVEGTSEFDRVTHFGPGRLREERGVVEAVLEFVGDSDDERLPGQLVIAVGGLDVNADSTVPWQLGVPPCEALHILSDPIRDLATTL